MHRSFSFARSSMAWTSQKRIPYIKMGRLVRFNMDEVNKWLERQRVEAYEGEE